MRKRSESPGFQLEPCRGCQQDCVGGGGRQSHCDTSAEGARAIDSMMESKSVIFTADDFGASPEVNAGILRAHREGVLRGASLMVAAPARDAAVAAARQCPDLSVGLHLVACKRLSERPAARPGGLVGAAGT